MFYLSFFVFQDYNKPNWKVNDNWLNYEILLTSHAERSYDFGYSVSIDRDYVIVGALKNYENGQRFGSAYIFKRDNPKLKNIFDNSQDELYSKADIDKIKKISSNQIDLTFENIASLVTNGAFAVLGINSMDDEKNIYLSHWVTIAGVKTALSQSS